MVQCSYTKNLKNLLLHKIHQLKFSKKKNYTNYNMLPQLLKKKKKTSRFFIYFVTIVIDFQLLLKSTTCSKLAYLRLFIKCQEL